MTDRFFFFVFVGFLFGGPAYAASSAPVGSTFYVYYGVVEDVQTTTITDDSSAAPGTATGAVLGGLAGAAASDDHSTGSAVAGAVLGGLIARVAAKHYKKKKAHEAWQYTVKLNSGQVEKMIVDHGDIRVADCVAVEHGPTNNIRLVSSTNCDKATAGLEHPAITANAQYDAAACHTAKEAALNATTETQMDLALKKVRVFCET